AGGSCAAGADAGLGRCDDARGSRGSRRGYGLIGCSAARRLLGGSAEQPSSPPRDPEIRTSPCGLGQRPQPESNTAVPGRIRPRCFVVLHPASVCALTDCGCTSTDFRVARAATLPAGTFTRTGTERSVVVPSPSCPRLFDPQQYACPPTVTAQVW